MRISDWSSDVCSSDLFLLAQRQILARYAGSLVLALLLETGSRDRRANLNTLGDSFLGPLYEAIPVFLLGEPGFRFDRCRQDVRLRGLDLRVGRIIPMRIAPELFGRSTRFWGGLLCHARSLCRVLCFAGLISRRQARQSVG